MSQYPQENSCIGVFLIKLQAFRTVTLSKRHSKHVLSYEICEIFKNTFFYRPAVVAPFEDRVLSDRFNYKANEREFFP